MISTWQPQWTTPVRIESGGRYPLGLNRFHEGLDGILIKGVIGAANRLRYISYCCWIIGDIEKDETCVEYSDFVDAFSRRENALALGLYLMEPDYSVGGSDAMSKIVKDELVEYDCTFRLMQSNDLGAYGLYYAGTTYNWGLTETDEKGITRLTKVGKKLYSLIDLRYQQEQPEYYKNYKGKKNIPVNVLLQWAKLNDFYTIRQPECEHEREFFLSILFRLEKKEVADYRRDTFAFVMKCIKECYKANTEFDENVLRNVHYYSSFIANSGKTHKFSIPNCFNDVHFFWSVYEGHVYYRWWLSKYFEIFLTHLKSCGNGSSIDEFFADVDTKKFNDTIYAFCGEESNYYEAPSGILFDLFSGALGLQDSISVESITNDEKYTSISEVLAKFVLVVAGLYVQFKSARSDKRYLYLTGQLTDVLWFDSLFKFNKLEKISVHTFLKTVLRRQIINQHDLMMIEKNDLRRCWFTTENKRNYHQADVSLIWRPAKYDTIMNFLSDMKLIEKKNDMAKLSEEGETFFQQLMSEYY